MRDLLKSAAWLAVMSGLALALAVAQPWISDRLGARHSRPPAAGDAAPAPRSLFESAVVVESLGRFPSSHVVYDPAAEGRLYAGAQTSLDGGRTWSPLVDSAGRSVALLGAARSVAPALAPEARLVFGEVLFEEPGVSSGLGLVAHAVEWRDGRWEILLPAREDPALDPRSEELWPHRVVRSVGYLPDGLPVVVTANSLRIGTSQTLETPGRLRTALVTSTGAIYAAVQEPGRFDLYKAETANSPWLPIPDTGPLEALAEGEKQIVYLAGQRGLARWDGALGQWTPWPAGHRPTHAAAHPRAPYVAAWGDGLLSLSQDGGGKLIACRLGDLQVAWAAWDPFAMDALTAVDVEGNAVRLKLESVR